MRQYEISAQFNFTGFLYGCYKAGLKLFRRAEGEEVAGSASLDTGRLLVDLTNETQEQLDIITAQIPLFNDGQAAPNLCPDKVSPRQIRIAMVMSGLDLSQVEAYIASLPEPDKTCGQISWEYAIEIERSDCLVNAVAAVYNLTPSQVDDIFILAETI